MHKYQQLLVKSVRSNLENWTTGNQKIEQSELYRFLHSIKGTAATIGMEKASQTAARLMSEMHEEEQKEWNKEELQTFLLPLISLFYYGGTQNEKIKADSISSNKDFDLVVLFEENPAIIMHMKETLENQGYVVIAVTDFEHIHASYFEFKPKIVLIGGELEKKEGWQGLCDVRKNAHRDFTPLVILDNENTSASRTAYYLEGADDVFPPFIPSKELVVRIAHLIDRKQRIDQYTVLDELTRVYNRKQLVGAYEQLRNKLEHKNEHFSMVLIDIDWFKDINDTYGHTVGDMVLESLAQLLKDELRSPDIIIRYGGEEFLILLPGTTSEEARYIMERLLLHFQTVQFQITDKPPFSCTFSAGIHEVSKSVRTLKENLDETDKVLYKAKEAGRNQVLTTEDMLNESLKKRISVAVIDDDPIIRAMLSNLVSKSALTDTYQLDLETFYSGKNFIDSDWNEKKTPYLILLDGVMPEMDGLDVLKALRRRPDQKKFTILMLTSRDSEQDIARAIELGADDYLTKPFKLLELEARIGYLVKRMK